jgi:hypothetical protein
VILNNNNKFDIDLQYGQVREEELSDILQNAKIEVKTERDKWKETGNICIEFRCRGKPSGIAVTEAKWWVHVLANGDDTSCMLMFPTEKLKELARKYYANGKIVNGGDDNLSEMVLLPLKEIFK